MSQVAQPRKVAQKRSWSRLEASYITLREMLLVAVVVVIYALFFEPARFIEQLLQKKVKGA